MELEADIKRDSFEQLKQKIKTGSFGALKLRPDVLKAVKSFDIHRPSGIQLMAIPEIMHGKNVLCAAETGSGKTIAYLAPIFNALKLQEQDDGILRLIGRPRALIVVPTRELV